MPDYILMQAGIDCDLKIIQEHSDYNGKKHHTFYNITRAKGFNFHITDDAAIYNPSMLIPVDRAATQSVVDFLQMQRLMAHDEDQRYSHNAPYYFTLDMSRDVNFEERGRAAVLFNGQNTDYAQNAYFQDRLSDAQSPLRRAFNALFGITRDDSRFNPHRTPMARYNCWTATQGITQYVAGIDLGAIDSRLPQAYRAAHALRAFQDLLKHPPQTAETIARDNKYKRDFCRAGELVTRPDMPPVLMLRSGHDSLMDILNRRAFSCKERLHDFFAASPVFKKDVPVTIPAQPSSTIIKSAAPAP